MITIVSRAFDRPDIRTLLEALYIVSITANIIRFVGHVPRNALDLEECVQR